MIKIVYSPPRKHSVNVGDAVFAFDKKGVCLAEDRLLREAMALTRKHGYRIVKEEEEKKAAPAPKKAEAAPAEKPAEKKEEKAAEEKSDDKGLFDSFKNAVSSDKKDKESKKSKKDK